MLLDSLLQDGTTICVSLYRPLALLLHQHFHKTLLTRKTESICVNFATALVMHLPICHCLPLYHVPCESIITLVMSLCLSYGRQFFYLIQFYKKVQQSVLSLYRIFAFLLHHKTLVAKKLKAVAFSALLLWWWYYTTKNSILPNSWLNAEYCLLSYGPTLLFLANLSQ